MGLIETIRNKLPTLRNTNTTYSLINDKYETTQPVKQHDLYDKALDNLIVGACVDAHIETTLACGYNITNNNSRAKTNTETQKYLIGLLEKPHGIQGDLTWSGVVKLIWESLLITGDVFFEKSYDDKYGVWNGYTHIPTREIAWDNQNDCYMLINHPDVQYENEDLIHMYLPESRNKHAHFGTSLIDRCAGSLAILTNAIKYNNDVLINHGVNPKTIYKFSSSTSNRNVMSEMKRLIAMQKKENIGYLALKDVDVINPAETSKDMSYMELMDFACKNILRTFRVPPEKVGFIDTASIGSGKGESQDKTWKDTFNGRSRFITEPINQTFQMEGFEETFSLNPLDTKEEMIDAQKYSIYLQNGVMTRDEVRNELGLQPLNNTWEDYYR